MSRHIQFFRQCRLDIAVLCFFRGPPPVGLEQPVGDAHVSCCCSSASSKAVPAECACWLVEHIEKTVELLSCSGICNGLVDGVECSSGSDIPEHVHLWLFVVATPREVFEQIGSGASNRRPGSYIHHSTIGVLIGLAFSYGNREVGGEEREMRTLQVKHLADS